MAAFFVLIQNYLKLKNIESFPKKKKILCGLDPNLISHEPEDIMIFYGALGSYLYALRGM